MIKEAFFPTFIYGKDLQLDNKYFEREIVEWSKQNPGVKKTNVNGWHSETQMHQMPQKLISLVLIEILILMMLDRHLK